MDDFDGQINDKLVKRKLPLSKVLFAILAIILLAEVVYAVRVLTSPPPPPPQQRPVESKKEVGGKISLTAPKNSFAVNESVPVAVVIDTGTKRVDGMDVIVRFDPKTLEASTAGLVKGKIFDDYPEAAVDAKLGVVSISGISSLASSFQGTGQLALVNFKAKAKGKTSLVIEYQKGATTDSNMVETGTSKDILEGVGNLDLEIR